MKKFTWGKLWRILNMLRDKSEIFDEEPSFRFTIIKSIWNETNI